MNWPLVLLGLLRAVFSLSCPTADGVAATGGVAGVAASPSPPFDLDRRLLDLHLSYVSYCGDNVDEAFDCYWCKKLENILAADQGSFEWVGNFGSSATGSGLHSGATIEAAFGTVGCMNFQGTSTVEVAWRGTDNLAGWVDDADFVQVPYNGSTTLKAHAGFVETEAAHASEVKALVVKAAAKCNGTKELVLTGHSLGAGIATMSALRLVDDGYMVQLITFGSPRPGNDAFAKHASSYLPRPVQRFSHNRDIIPHLPPSDLLIFENYHHLPTEYWQNGAGDFVECNGSGEDTKCADKVLVTDPVDHATYLNVNICDGVLHGCLYTDP